MSISSELNDSEWKCMSCKKIGTKTVETYVDLSDFYETSTALWEVSIYCNCGNSEVEIISGDETSLHAEPAFSEFEAL